MDLLTDLPESEGYDQIFREDAFAWEPPITRVPQLPPASPPIKYFGRAPNASGGSLTSYLPDGVM